MSTENNITFESDKFKYKSRVILGQTQVPGMTKFLLGKGIVKNEKQAMSILSITTVLFLGLSIFIIYTNFFKEPAVPTITPEQEMFYNLERDALDKLNKSK